MRSSARGSSWPCRTGGVKDAVQRVAMSAHVARAVYEGESADSLLMSHRRSRRSFARSSSPSRPCAARCSGSDRRAVRGKAGEEGADEEAAATLLWMFTSRDVYHKLVHDAGLLNVGYAEIGPANGPVVILLHGWPYDIHSFDEVTPLLAATGYRVMVPYLRGYGRTRFPVGNTFRNGQQAARGRRRRRPHGRAEDQTSRSLGGYDWGARTADIVAARWPERGKALVSVSGYLIGNQAASKTPLPPRRNTRGGIGFYCAPITVAPATKKIPHDFAKLIWRRPRRNGRSTTPFSIAAQRRWTTPTTSTSSSSTTGGG